MKQHLPLDITVIANPFAICPVLQRIEVRTCCFGHCKFSFIAVLLRHFKTNGRRKFAENLYLSKKRHFVRCFLDEPSYLANIQSAQDVKTSPFQKFELKTSN